MEQNCLMEQDFSCFLFFVLCRTLVNTCGLEHVFLFHMLHLDFLLIDSGEARDPTPEIRKAVMFLY